MSRLSNIGKYLRTARVGGQSRKTSSALHAPGRQPDNAGHPDNAAHEPAPAIFVIFGITGDLAQKKLLPALYHLLKDNLLNEHTVVVGVSRRDMSADDLLKKVELCVIEADKTCDPAVLDKFRAILRMVKLDPVVGEDYTRLHQTLDQIEDEQGMCMNRLYYLAIPPQVYEPVIENLGTHGLNAGCQHSKAVSRLLVEKPFGYDLTSAAELITSTGKYFTEEQIFRIDHYLAKETAQNILIFRQHNPVFNTVWNCRHISAIDLIFSEQIGVEGRAAFYDNVGALRDVVQNHLLQLLALTTMELPGSNDPSALHAAKQALLADVRSVDPDRDRVVRAQYRGYQEEVSNPGSGTETYVSISTSIANDRWQNTAVTLTAGKALDVKKTNITLTFTDPAQQGNQNRLTFRISPNEGIDIELTVKQPGFDDRTENTHMDFSYKHAFGNSSHPDAYERVLVDAVKGDHSLFATSEEVLESWRIVQPVLTAWSQDNDDLSYYEPGSGGPSQA